MPIPENAEPTAAQPYYVRDTQDWAVQQERQRHSQAILTVGEYAMFVLMWHVEDHRAGLVQTCRRCRGTGEYASGDAAQDAVNAGIQAAYGQSTQARCPDCYGTTFEGGFKARIVRPAIISDSDRDEQRVARGVMENEGYTVESTPDFRIRSFDYVFRATGERLQLRVPQRVTLRTGFATPHQTTEGVGYNMARANLEAHTSVAYDIGPDQATVKSVLTMGSRVPFDFTPYETVRAALIPPNSD